jgi:prepilin-type N-terminal cleavage/methylation domain-containing protein
MPNRLLSIRSRPAFTIVELMVVIAVIAILIALLMPNLRLSREQAKASNCLSNVRQIGIATRMYGDDFIEQYPYGVPVPHTLVDHPHYTTWRGGGVRGGGVPPQQQFFEMKYITDPNGYICPTDPHPANYVWWDYDVHPDIKTGSSYMFSEYALFGIAWQERRRLTFNIVWQPSTFVWATDGWMCPNGWTWGTTDPNDPVRVPPEVPRIDWSHLGTINAVYGDGHGERKPQENARYLLRTHPIKNF